MQLSRIARVAVVAGLGIGLLGFTLGASKTKAAYKRVVKPSKIVRTFDPFHPKRGGGAIQWSPNASKAFSGAIAAPMAPAKSAPNTPAWGNGNPPVAMPPPPPVRVPYRPPFRSPFRP